MTKIPAILLMVLLGLWGVLISAMMTRASDYPGAVAHPQQAQMHVAGPSAEFDLTMLRTGQAVGILIVAVFVLCLLLGSGKNGASATFAGVVIVSAAVLMSVFLMMTSTISEYVQSPSPKLIGGFPVPTAWMVFGVWLTPILFLAVYIAGFRQWVMTEDDQQRLSALVARRRASGSD